MASIAFDGQSFQIDGKRIWLASGTIHYLRTPRTHWAERINQAKLAGLNTITIPVVWSRHEPRPGQFDFSGDNDLRHFVDLVGKAGMYAIIRIGPFIGSGYDMGGLPAWLLLQKDIALRTANTVFLEFCSRYFSAVARQIGDLQVTAKPTAILVQPANTAGPAPSGTSAAGVSGGAVLLVQNETNWTCGQDELANGYLGELNRYLRESGFEVPIINSNQLWQGVEGEVDCWTGNDNLLANLRQLGQVRATSPRLLSEYRVGETAVWGDTQTSQNVTTPERLIRDLTEVLAAGAQFNIESFSAGTSFGFSAGRLPHGADTFPLTVTDAGAPVDEGGHPGPLYEPLRRVAMFASRFARVLSGLDSRRQPVAILPASVIGVEGTKPKGLSRHVMVFTTGSQGSIGFVFGDGTDRGSTEQPAELLLTDGTTIPAYLGGQPVVWCLFDVRLSGRSTLDYCNLSAFAMCGRVFVAYGPSGTPARLSINGSSLEVTVPGPKEDPEIIDHEGITVVIACHEHLPKIQVADDAVYIGCTSLTPAGEPVVLKADSTVMRIGSDGVAGEVKYTPAPKPKPAPVVIKEDPAKKGKLVKIVGKKTFEPMAPALPAEPKHISVSVAQPNKTPPAPHLAEWHGAAMADYCDGTSARFASINGPADLTTLGAPYGYGWYKIAFKSKSGGKAHIAWPQSGDRVHLFIDGEPLGTIGAGPGATTHLGLPLRKAGTEIVVLAENLGRSAGGSTLGEKKGCFGHIFEVQALKVGKPELVKGQPVEAGAAGGLLLGIHKSDTTEPQRVTFHLPHKRKTSLIVRISTTAHRGVILLDDQPLKVFDSAGPTTLLFDSDELSRGNHSLQFAILSPTSPADALRDLAEAVSFDEVTENLTEAAQWSFAKWEQPSAGTLNGKAKSAKHQPCWHHSYFAAQPLVPVAGHPLKATMYFETTGLSKGQIYINGKHLGRYFAATSAGKAVGPQALMLVPESMLVAGRNEITVFDEHGFSPAKTRLLYK